MERAVAGYAAFKGVEEDALTTNDPMKEPSVYQFAYWLFRYSGLVDVYGAEDRRVLLEALAAARQEVADLRQDITDIEAEVSTVYWEVTDGRFSKPNTRSGYILSEFERQLNEAAAEAEKEANARAENAEAMFADVRARVRECETEDKERAEDALRRLDLLEQGVLRERDEAYAHVKALKAGLQWALEEGGWRLIYHASEPPPSVIDARDRHNPKIVLTETADTQNGEADVPRSL